ncbi:8-oxoguanine DNA glycosylase OGG fold protein [Streptomyces phaeochromogenes]
MWSDGNWSSYRYEVYLSFMHAAALQLAASDGWPSGAAPDLLERALFNTVWRTSS